MDSIDKTMEKMLMPVEDSKKIQAIIQQATQSFNLFISHILFLTKGDP